jgi:hypothetical protein
MKIDNKPSNLICRCHFHAQGQQSLHDITLVVSSFKLDEYKPRAITSIMSRSPSNMISSG